MNYAHVFKANPTGINQHSKGNQAAGKEHTKNLHAVLGLVPPKKK